MPLDVVFENAEFLVVNKPQDLVCHPTKGDVYSSLISRARLYLGATAYLVNRLDRETSGLVLVAKTSEVAGELGKLFEAKSNGTEPGQVRKHYTAIVHGWVQNEEGLIDAPLGKDVSSAVAIKDCVRLDGASAETRFSVVDRFERDGRPFTWLRVRPVSGRKHQIRIHLAHIGHSIVGDKIYGMDEQLYLRFVEKRITPEDWRQLILPNHALHAGGLDFFWRGQQWEFRANEPEQFHSFRATKAE